MLLAQLSKILDNNLSYHLHQLDPQFQLVPSALFLSNLKPSFTENFNPLRQTFIELLISIASSPGSNSTSSASIAFKTTMNPQSLVQELVRQNRLLKETINQFPLLLNLENQKLSSSSSSSIDSDSSSNHLALSPFSSILGDNPTRESIIETLLNLLDRQDLRLNHLQQFGKSILLESSIPVFRALKESKEGLEDLSVKDWADRIMNHLRRLKSFNNKPIDPKESIKFIHDHLDLEPLQLIRTLLLRNRDLVRSSFPHQIPPKCLNLNDNIDLDESLLFEYPFKLYLLRHPKALLNFICSKFDATKNEDQRWKNRLQLQPINSLSF
ncbi:hypothetical protein O181_077809 [Austropuccinia psidii MF-1]|uniref:Uncharacterized protein n=1 Tax=Austropuccinia psidii MF-1 TaxID=1389203 RepID=A0A9Q3FF85_9BASI|nr:hypothetical protein [Austropuccinia psidii MF-1]